MDKNTTLEPIKINEGEVLILKLEVLIHPREIEKIRNNIIKQVKEGVVMVPKGMQYTICKRSEVEQQASELEVIK